MIDPEWLDLLNQKGICTVSPSDWSTRVEEFRAILTGALRLDGELVDLHRALDVSSINELRLKSIVALNQDQERLDWFLEPLYPFLREIVGRDCLRQKRINLVIHMPQDGDSTIPEHSDVLTGNSSFEVACWIPLTIADESNSMFIRPYEQYIENERGPYHLLKPTLDEVVFFKHFLPHGNQINSGNSTRISLNIRFKGLFSPENKKSIMDYYKVWKLSEFTKVAMQEWKDEN